MPPKLGSGVLGGHGQLCSPMSLKAALQQSHLAKPNFRARLLRHYGRFRVIPHLGHPLVRAAQSSSDPSITSSPVSQISEDGKLNGAKEGNKESIMIKLKRYGVAGMLSYGLLNTVYYLGMFLFAWFYLSPAPSGLGYQAAAERFIKLFALVWAGSQVTKLLRAGCALALAPAVDRGLSWLTDHSKFRSRAEVFRVVVLSCFGLALVVFLVMTTLWA